jgi:hypothetical protein
MTSPALEPESSMFDRAMTMWREIDFPLVCEDDPRLASFLEPLRRLYANGRAIHRRFAIPQHADFQEFIERGRLHDVFFFGRFWQARSVAAALPYPPHEPNLVGHSEFAWTQRVALPGILATPLVRGGAYESWNRTAREAMQLGLTAAEVLLEGDFEEPTVFVSESAWSSFFFDVAWDYTVMVIDAKRRRIEVLLATDTD